MSAASQLRRALEAESSELVFHSSLDACAIPSMGGGMGAVATADIPPGAVLARMPFRTMITVKKARANLAMVEVALERGVSSFKGGVIPFIASPLTATALDQLVSGDGTVAALKAKVALLERRLSGTDTIACYLVLLAALYGRWASDGQSRRNQANKEEEEAATLASSGGTGGTVRPVLRFTHENAWMGMWICGLPAAYDNLLELGIRGDHGGVVPGPTSEEEGVAEEEGGELGKGVSDGARIHGTLGFPRHADKVIREQAEVWQRYRHCLGLLRCLQCLPHGVLVQADAAGRVDSSTAHGEATDAREEGPQRTFGAMSCTMRQFVWGFNSLMSRGFAFDEDVWAMMPYVDYFNYALDSNGTMFSQRKGAGSVPAQTKGRARLFHRGGKAADAVDGFTFSEGYEYVFKTVQPVNAGEQVLLHYGAYSDFELLLWYGFTLSPFLRPEAPLGVTGEDSSAPSMHDADLVIRQLLCETTRRQIFHAWKGRASLLENAPAKDNTKEAEKGGTDHNAGDGVDDDEDDGYAEWERALQRAYSHVFTPLADTDGNYPEPSTGEASWLGTLMASFASAPPAPPCARTPSSLQTAQRVDASARALAQAWLKDAAGMERLMASKDLVSPAGPGMPAALGVLGASAQMTEAIRLLARLSLRSAAANATTTARAVVGGVETQTAALRALAWMELCTRGAYDGASGGIAQEEDGGDGGWVLSGNAVRMAKRLTTDVEALLRFLSVEATEEELHAYLDRVPDY